MPFDRTRHARLDDVLQYLSARRDALPLIALQEVYGSPFVEDAFARIASHFDHSHASARAYVVNFSRLALQIGQVTLSAYPIVRQEAYRVRRAPARCVLFTLIDSEVGPLNLFNVHSGTRLSILKEVLDFAESVAQPAAPTILVGDFNWDYRRSSPHRDLCAQRGFALAGVGPTCTLNSSTLLHSRHVGAIDFALYKNVGEGMGLIAKRVLDEPVGSRLVSDHAGVLVDVFTCRYDGERPGATARRGFRPTTPDTADHVIHGEPLPSVPAGCRIVPG